ncbi:MAG: caspase family protein [Pseudomonadota bacterium]
MLLNTYFLKLKIIGPISLLFYLSTILFFVSIPTSHAFFAPEFSDCLEEDSDEYDQLEACQILIQTNSQRRDLHVTLGKILKQRKKSKKLIKAYKKALAIFPNDEYFNKQLMLAKGQTGAMVSKKDSNKTAKPPTSSTVKENTTKQVKNTKQTATKTAKYVSSKPVYKKTISKKKTAYKKTTLVKKSTPKKTKITKIAAKKSAEKTHSPKQSIAKQQAMKEVLEKKVRVKKTTTNKAVVTIAKVERTATINNNKIVRLRPEQAQFLEQLQFLKSLKSQDIISQAEYQQRKKALLDEKFRVVVPAQSSDVKANALALASEAIKKSYSKIDFGNYHALIIGNNSYKYLPELKTAVHDAEVLAKLLEQQYGFKVKLLLNANRYDTLKELSIYRRTLTKKDNLLIYYAGHGVLDNASERGYWLPVDAEKDYTSNWISTAEITDTLKALQSLHVLVVADSCYSGTLVRSAPITFTNPEDKKILIKRLLKKKSRTAITSGGLEPVSDSGGDNHSVFAQAFLDVLRTNDSVIEAEGIFSRLRDKVILNADQTPEYSNVRKVGHNGGDFIFQRK